MPKKRKQNLWTVPVSTLRPLPHHPRITFLAREVVSANESYLWDAGHIVGPPHAVFQYTVRGEGRLDYRGKTHRLTPGTAFFVHNADPEMTYTNVPRLRQDWEILWCNISPGETLANDMVDRHGPVYPMPPDSWFLGQLRHHLCSGEDFVQLRLAESLHLVSRLMIELVECSKRTGTEDISSKLMQAFCEYVHMGMSKTMTVSDAAAHLKVSREHLTRTCQEQLHLSPGSYINQTKIREAMRLLRDPSYIVKEVSYRVGYPHPSHFARVFRRLVGVSPQEFRNSPGHTAISPLMEDASSLRS